ncbi:MAG: hypothetical protein VCB25_11940 [Myxococcota bacterium]
MTTFLRGFAYICIWSTPFQIGFCLWALGIVMSTDASLFSLTNDVFFADYLPLVHRVVKPLAYLILPNALADILWSIPIAIHSLFKAVTSTWLGFWILKKIN